MCEECGMRWACVIRSLLQTCAHTNNTAAGMIMPAHTHTRIGSAHAPLATQVFAAAAAAVGRATRASKWNVHIVLALSLSLSRSHSPTQRCNERLSIGACTCACVRVHMYVFACVCACALRCAVVVCDWQKIWHSGHSSLKIMRNEK